MTAATSRSAASLASPSYVAGLLRSGEVRPKRRLGQNFLVDRNVLGRVVAAAGAGRGLTGATALEIGAGFGGLTLALVEAGAARVVAVEKDATLARLLAKNVAGRDEVVLAVGDALALDLRALCGGEAVVVGNLPYSVTTPLLLRLLEPPLFWPRAVVMVQLEVAQRILAPPGGKDYGALTLAVAAQARPSLAFRVSRHSFLPQPEVDSAVVILERREVTAGGLDAAGLGRLAAVVRAAFGQRRKTLANALAAGLGLDRAEVTDLVRAAGVDPARRGETLELEEYVELERALRPALETAGRVWQAGRGGL